MFENIDWNLLIPALGVIFAGGWLIVGIYRAYYDLVLPRKDERRLEEKESLEALKNEYSRCAWSIEGNIKGIIEGHEGRDFTASLYKSNGFGKELQISEELERHTQEYNRRFELYKVLKTSSKRFIVSEIETKVKQKFPKSMGNHVPIKNMLTEDFLMARYLNGEKVTESWFKDSKPKELKEIIKKIEESEREVLDVFFLELNSEFKDDEVLQRFRKEKEELVKYGKETIANLGKKANSITEQLKKYGDLRTTRAEEKP